ncbi:DUF4300 family protein [Streptococcus sp. zg-86]|uniref:DUF4300 family protein n=1 Tax=Streptococcus zhangguiae TaxID=2664091 RepID=A0A6I4RUB9_9STRE|nr:MULTISPECIES: DUF4300 family protein [unclassified Streptococcus]MTB64745.1 DUF4300 family protein [Streptococcus sp. zg-86]MTB91317.1 DUF4300 family protein [Streptococcus sp. zg-36]MWV56752.1 DUF4300 family protein [Streptococcus sp. zg-70]QTH48484.1 DUF4300 family protein [Streptococcus sp. zg-86]
MKTVFRGMKVGLCAVVLLGLGACSQGPKTAESQVANETTVASSQQEMPQWTATYTNLASRTSVEDVQTLLLTYLDKDSVDAFFKLVNEYNEIVASAGLQGDFAPFSKTEYDVEKISNLWTEKHSDFVGTNCRINSYVLLKNQIDIPQSEKDDALLFIDNDAIENGRLFDTEDKEAFNRLFSRVKTESTTDVKVHAKKMENFLSQFKFDENARMLSVVLHDNLDGEALFIGHVGVLVPTNDGFVFVEKLSFEEPYQAIKFETKEDCYQYLLTKYADYTGEGLAKPFIMDNNKWAQ